MGKGKGKAKIEIKKIESLQVRKVTFSKRRNGLFRKAVELCKLFPDVRIAAVAFSPAGNPYFLGDPHSLLLNVTGAVTQDKEKEKGEEESREEEISAESSIPILEFDTTSAVSSSLCQDDFDFSVEDLDLDLDGFDAEEFVNGSVAEEEKEKGEEERREEIAAAESSNWFYPEMPILEFDTTFAASSSLCQEIPNDDFDYSPEDLDLDGLDGEAFVNQFLAINTIFVHNLSRPHGDYISKMRNLWASLFQVSEEATLVLTGDSTSISASVCS